MTKRLHVLRDARGTPAVIISDVPVVNAAQRRELLALAEAAGLQPPITTRVHQPDPVAARARSTRASTPASLALKQPLITSPQGEHSSLWFLFDRRLTSGAVTPHSKRAVDRSTPSPYRLTGH